MLNKLIAVKVLAALSVAGVGTGAAAGELPDPLQNLASEAAEVVSVEIPHSDEAPGADEAKLTKEQRDAVKAARKAEKAEAKAERKAAKAAQHAAEGKTDDTDEADDAKDGVHPDNHGKVVSECARTTPLKGREKGQAIAALARGDVDTCGEQSSEPAPPSAESADDAKAAAKAARQAEKDVKKAAKEERKASKNAGATNPAL